MTPVPLGTNVEPTSNYIDNRYLDMDMTHHLNILPALETPGFVIPDNDKISSKFAHAKSSFFNEQVIPHTVIR